VNALDEEIIMKKFLWLVIGLMTVYSIFIADSTGGYAFVTPEHYEKIKQQAREKDKNQEKPIQNAPPGKIQVHQAGEGQDPLRKLNPK
jgi:uncharacterized membrane protein SpoIIM required for sporulation